MKNLKNIKETIFKNGVLQLYKNRIKVKKISFYYILFLYFFCLLYWFLAFYDLSQCIIDSFKNT